MTYLCFGMFVAEIHSPDACACTKVENTANFGTALVRRSKAQLPVQRQVENMVLQVFIEESAEMPPGPGLEACLPRRSFSASSFGKWYSARRYVSAEGLFRRKRVTNFRP